VRDQRPASSTTRPEDYRDTLYSAYRSSHFDAVAAQEPSSILGNQILPHLPVDRGSRILELGCGSGELLRLLAEHGYSDTSGVDVSAEQIARAHDSGISAASHGDVFDHLADVTDAYDAIVAVDVLEHLRKAEVVYAAQAACRALRPGGRLVLRVPNAQSPFGGRFRYGDFTHETSFTQHSVRQVLLACGFAQVEVFPADPVAHGSVSAIRLILWKLLAAGLKGALAVETGILRGHIVTQNIISVGRAPLSTGTR
jgi:2-polyprenyl-3-methyl-5-hydroxy-6-metoxy-1,4-benzoquinol methylase